MRKITTQSILNRQAFLAGAATFRQEQITLEGLGTVNVRELSAADTKELARRETAKDADEVATMAWVVVQTLCDDEGRPLLTDADLAAVAAMPFRVLKAINVKAGILSGLRAADGKDPVKNDVAA